MQGMDIITTARSFSDLPSDILTSIADRLPMIELLSFRGTCNSFRSASSTASAAVESGRTPWLLLHKADTSECLIYNDEESKTYNRKIPDLQGAICLASYHGWLLLFKNESIFFFCPISFAKITLPDFPHKQIDGHVAAFSDVPTSRTCIVSVINRIDETFVEVNLISKGESSWTPHTVPHATSLGASIIGATYDRRNNSFYYMDDKEYYLEYSVKNNKWSSSRIIMNDGSDSWNDLEMAPYSYRKHVFRKRIEEDKRKRERFNIEDDEFVAVCGLSYGKGDSEGDPLVYLNEVVDNDSPAKKRVRRAVWIQPRFFEADSNQRWETE